MIEEYIESIKKQIEDDFDLAQRLNLELEEEYPYCKYYFDAYLVYNMYLLQDSENKNEDRFSMIQEYDALISIIVSNSFKYLVSFYYLINKNYNVDEIIDNLYMYCRNNLLWQENIKDRLEEFYGLIHQQFSDFNNSKVSFSMNKLDETLKGITKELDRIIGEKVFLYRRYKGIKEILCAFNLEFDRNEEIKNRSSYDRKLSNEMLIYAFTSSLKLAKCNEIITTVLNYVKKRFLESLFVMDKIVRKDFNDIDNVCLKLRELINVKSVKVNSKGYKENVSGNNSRCFSLMTLDGSMVYFSLSGLDYCKRQYRYIYKKVESMKNKEENHLEALTNEKIENIALNIKSELLESFGSGINVVYAQLNDTTERYYSLDERLFYNGLSVKLRDDLKAMTNRAIDKMTKDRIGSAYGCCERKMLSCCNLNGKAFSKKKMKCYIKYLPCDKCSPALYYNNIECFALYNDYNSMVGVLEKNNNYWKMVKPQSAEIKLVPKAFFKTV